MNTEKKNIELRICEIDKQMSTLQTEKEELLVAVRVIERFASGPESSSNGGQKLGPARPLGTPSTFEMASMILRSPKAVNGLTMSELVAEMRVRYWPGLTPQQVRPSIYQFSKKGRLHKTAGGKFKAASKQDSESEVKASDSDGM